MSYQSEDNRQTKRRRPKESKRNGRNDGIPWELLPSRGVTEMKSRAHTSGAGSREDVVPEPQIRQVVPRRMRVGMDDVEKCGYSAQDT